jgi:hypothetical protein
VHLEMLSGSLSLTKERVRVWALSAALPSLIIPERVAKCPRFIDTLAQRGETNENQLATDRSISNRRGLTGSRAAAS